MEPGRAELDDAVVELLRDFCREPVARACSRSWNAHLYDALHLGVRLRFLQAVRQKGLLNFHHSTFRDLGGLQESATYQFDIAADGSYVGHWSRTFDAWTSDSERQRGTWAIDGKDLVLSTLGPPADEPTSTAYGQRECERSRYAPAGRVFAIPCDLVLTRRSDGTSALPWEYAARGLAPRSSHGRSEPAAVELAPRSPSPEPSAVHFVTIDGAPHEVSLDIVNNYPECDWERLMRVRMRFGIGGAVNFGG